ncbi:MAG TPA: efflux RND transporter periplasmic adaptor subunit [Gemmatimonadaceae bacterium]|nr:efflux RND transporter periplasmic adaptor subunit [Gemmatimonadaceae bacterium]
MTSIVSMHNASAARHVRPSTVPAAGAALALLLALAACGRDGDAKTETKGGDVAARPALVLGPQDVATARLGAAGATVTVSGPLDPRETVTLRAQVAGTIRDVRVDRGSPVRRGQLLVSIQAAGVQSQAAGARAGVAGAEAALALAAQRLDAARTLREAGAMSQIDYQTAVSQHAAAEAQLAAARAQAASAGETAGYTSIVSPIDGVVSDRRVEGGEPIRVGDDLLTVVNASTLELAGQIGVAEASRVRAGQAVSFSIDAFPAEAFRGRVARVDPTADPGTRQVGVYVELPNPGGRIIGGQFARGRIATAGSGPAPTAVLIPETAVRRDSAGAPSGSVFVIESGRIARRAVTLGARDESEGIVAVLSGVRAGEQVVAALTADIAEGTQVTVTADSARSGAAVTAAPAAKKE